MTQNPKVIRLYDRSRTVTDWQCPRKRYWQYEYPDVEGRPRGITPNHTHLELALGTALHDGLAAIAHGVDIASIANTAHKQVFDMLVEESTAVADEVLDFANEQASLIKGLLLGFHRHVWPQISQHEIVAIEQEMIFRHGMDGKYDPDGEFGFMSKPDLVIRTPDGLVYIEYKSTSSKKESWIHSWETAVQLHSTMRAIEAWCGEAPVAVIVQGLYKGYESYGKQSSPFCYAYKRGGNPPFSQGELRYDYAAGFKRFPTWQLDGGVEGWVAKMPEQVLLEQFPCTPQIFINDALVTEFFRERAKREAEIRDADHSSTEALSKSFPHRWDQCIPYFGKPCGYRWLCFGKVDNPLERGYVYREPHHTPEVEQWQETSISGA